MTTTTYQRPHPAIRAVSPPIIPGRTVDPQETAILTLEPPPLPGHHRARLTDLRGRLLTLAWVPSCTRVVVRGRRVFMHYDSDEWRQVPTVEVGTDGMPI